MQTGKVKFYNKEKKYGFIAGDDGKDYFFHASGISNDTYVMDGDKVEFKVVDGDRGPKAIEIKPVWLENYYNIPRKFEGFYLIKIILKYVKI